MRIQLYKLFYLLVFLLSGFVSLKTTAQSVSTYGFSQSVGTYTAITGGTVLGSNTSDDQQFVDPAVPLGSTTVFTGPGFSIGFNFTYAGNVYDRFAVENNGWISLGQSALTPSVDINTSSQYAPLSSTAANTPAALRSRIAGFGRDIVAAAAGNSELRFETIGSAPNRVCVIQWKNYYRFSATGTGLGDVINFQIRLNETTNVVDVVYGANTFGTTASTLTHVGLGGTVSTDFNNRETTTNWNATTAGATNAVGCSVGSTVTVPANGTTFKWTPPVPCTGSPNPGNTLSSANPACPSVNFTLSLQNNPAVSGLTYQWQTSPNGTTWTNGGGASTGSTYTTTQTVVTYYRCNVTCGANTTASTPIQITLNSFVNCYCSSGATSTADEDILNVTVGSLNNTSICGQVGPGPGSTAFIYNNYTSGTGAPAAPIIGQGSTVPFSLGIGTCGTGTFNNSAAIFIDLNQNGVFDVPAERLYLSAATSAGAHIETGTLSIPATATLGVTRMRVISAETAPANIVPCGSVSGGATSWGETEDYLVNIVSCVAGGFTSQPSAATISCGQTVSFTVAGNGTGVTYQWQESISGTFNNITNGGIYGGAQSTTLTLTGVPPSYNNYQYRCVITGTCTPATNSNAVTLTVTQPPAPTIFPAPPVSVCLGTAVPISITTAAGFGAPVTVTFTSPTLNTTIPENVAGISNVLAVSGIPTGAVITSASVRLNIAHAYVGDVMISLKAPNGNVLNLDNLLTGTNNPGVNFTNTVISSSGVTALSAGTAPWTGTFKPDGNTAATGAFGVPAGPTGFLPNTPTYAGLYSVPNGNWTIAMYDAGPPDVGTLTNWSLTITYTPIVAQQGIWTPSTGLFTDAAGSIPYTGTATSTVYAKPAASTTYSVSYTTAGCTSPATSVPVTVNTPVAISVQPANKSVCTDRSTTISVTATGTTPSYQWQVSTAGAGGPWSNIANNANYAGATSNALVISNPPTTWNTYQYRVVVSGTAPCGSVTSNPAILTVFALPTVGLSASPYTSLFPGLRTVLSATSSPGGVAYLWTLNGGAISAATASSWQVDVDGQGVYGVRVTDINGCVNNTNTVTIGDSVSGKVFIYPSPNKGQFQVRYHSVKGNQLARSVTVFDSKGSKVYSALIPVNRPYGRMDVDLRNIGPGVYTVELSDANGKRINTGSVVVIR